MLQVYQNRDLSSAVIAQTPKGHEIQLGDATVHEGREWMEATLEDGSVGYVLGPNARSHTSIGKTGSTVETIAATVGSPKPNEASEKVGLAARPDRRPVAGIVVLVLGILTAITQIPGAADKRSPVVTAGILAIVGLALILKLRTIFIVCLAVGFLALDMCSYLTPSGVPR
jgi:hypothetical protein